MPFLQPQHPSLMEKESISNCKTYPSPLSLGDNNSIHRRQDKKSYQRDTRIDSSTGNFQAISFLMKKSLFQTCRLLKCFYFLMCYV